MAALIVRENSASGDAAGEEADSRQKHYGKTLLVVRETRQRKHAVGTVQGRNITGSKRKQVSGIPPAASSSKGIARKQTLDEPIKRFGMEGLRKTEPLKPLWKFYWKS